jgi:ribosomal protein S18 acetylase RimI-like enzyme
MIEGLKIRRFIKGKDEGLWLKIWNAAFQDYNEDEFRPQTIKDMEIREKDPNFDPQGIFIAETHVKPVGMVNAFVDKQRKEKKGFVNNLGVVPEFRRRGIGRELVNTALQSLKERGMETAEAEWVRENKPACKLFESMGFSLIRVNSIMRIKLDKIPSDIGEYKELKIKLMEKNLDNIKLLNWIVNETFKEHFDFRPETLEETKHWVMERPWRDIADYYFGYADNELVGFVSIGIDSKFVKHQGIKRGWIDVIGVLKSLRRKGVGTALILHGIKDLKSRGMTEADLGVDDSNQTKAIELYKKVGFKVVHKHLTYLKKT